MPRTTDRAGNTLNSGAMDALLMGDVTAGWSLRWVDMDGAPATSASWIHHEVPQDAITGASRGLYLDQPGHLTLTLIADKTPTAPKAYWRVHMDCIIGETQPNHWPYFTGIIDSVSTRYELQDGAIVKFYDVEAYGVLQRAKGYHVNSLTSLPKQLTGSIYKLLGVCAVAAGSFTASGGGTDDLPGAVTTYNLQSGDTKLDNDAAFSSLYSGYASGNGDYTIDASVYPAQINWVTPPAAATTVYYRYYRVEYFGIRRYQSGTLPQFFGCPVNRDPRDLFHTEVSSYTTSGGNGVITPKDPIAYDSDRALLDPSAQVEYLSIVDADGTESIMQISSTSNAGVITLNGLPSFTPVEGDPIKVVTTEIVPAWEEFGQRTAAGTDHTNPISFWRASGYTASGAHSSSTTTITCNAAPANIAVGETIYIGAEQMYVSARDLGLNTLTVTRATNGSTANALSGGETIYADHPRDRFGVPHPDVGIVASGNYHWTTDTAYATASPVDFNHGTAPENHTEEWLKIILATNYRSTTGTGLFANDDITTYASSGATWSPTGAWMKNYLRYQVDMADILQEIKETALPPNAYIRDERDGKVSIRPYQQASTPHRWLTGIVSIDQESDPEPITATVVLAEYDEPINMAREWFSVATGMDANVSRAFDRLTGATTSQAAAATRGVLSFTIPGASPIQAFPLIDRLTVYGTGFVSLSLTQSGTDFWIPEATMLKLNGSTSPITIPGDVINRAASGITESSNWTLRVELYADNTAAEPGTAGTISEIEIFTKRLNAWRAELSNDASKVPSAYQPADPLTQFGSIWVQADPGDTTGAGTASARVSYLWAPTSYLKRVCPLYNASAASIRHRFNIIRLTGISQLDARQYGEDYQLEQTYRSTPYRIVARLDHRDEVGDTVAAPFPDGTVKNLMVEAIGDQGTELGTYTCTDRSATNRAAS